MDPSVSVPGAAADRPRLLKSQLLPPGRFAYSNLLPACGVRLVFGRD